jgi:hypothetical protein
MMMGRGNRFSGISNARKPIAFLKIFSCQINLIAEQWLF